MKQACRGVGMPPKANLSGGLEDEKRRQGRGLERGVGQAQENGQERFQGRHHGRRQRWSQGLS